MADGYGNGGRGKPVEMDKMGYVSSLVGTYYEGRHGDNYVAGEAPWCGKPEGVEWKGMAYESRTPRTDGADPFVGLQI